MGQKNRHLLFCPVETNEKVDQVETRELNTLLVNCSDDTNQGLEGIEHPYLMRVSKVAYTLVEQSIQVLPHGC